MSRTGINDVQDQVQKFWAPLIGQRLREDVLLPSLVNRDYDGEIKKGGDTVRVTEILDAKGEIRTVGVDADAFSSEKLKKVYVDVKADKRIVASYKFDDLNEVQSQIDMEDSKIRESLFRALATQLNDYCYATVAPSTATPDHTFTGFANIDADDLVGFRVAASQAKWNKAEPWYYLFDPVYYGDLLKAQTLVSSDFAPDQPVVAGQFVNRRFGWNILEDNSRDAKFGLGFHPDFMHLVMQQAPRVKVSDLHPNEQFAYVMSVDMVIGAKLSTQGPKMHMTVES
jgi:hypothetical protein